MSKQRIIKDEMWNDEWFYDLLPTQKLVWVFLLTNPRNNIAGVYQINHRWAANLIGIPAEEYSLCIAYFTESKKVLTYQDWVILVNFHKHQSNNPKVEAGVLRILAELPKDVARLLPWDSLCIAYRTLLNSTLLNLSVSEPNGPQKVTNLIENKNMGWGNNRGDDADDHIIDYDTREVKSTAPVSKKKYPNALPVFKLFLEVLGVFPANWKINRTQLQAAENLYTERGLEKVRNALEFYKENKDEKYCPQISQPSDLDAKYVKLSQFKTKHES